MGACDGVLRELPSVDLLLRSEEARGLLERHPAEFVAARARDLIDGWREAARAGTLDAAALAALKARAGAELLAAVRAATLPSLVRVINATGVVVHTNLGRAPWAEPAAARALEAARGYSNLEYDLERGERGRREAHLAAAGRLFGAEAALVVNNCAAALLLALDELARGRETVVSRGELIEIGGSFRIPEILEKSGSILREVGTTNRTRLADYERAIGERTALLLRVHPSNFRVVGFTESVALADLVALGRRHRLPVVEDLGSGQVVGLDALGLPGEPTVAQAVAAGADLVLFSGDKLLGGPQAGVVVGRAELVRRLGSNPLYRALRPDKVTIAALAETLAVYEAGAPWRDVPVLRMLRASAAELAPRARRLAERLTGLGYRAATVAGASTVGGGAAPLSSLATELVAVTHPARGAAAIEAALRRHSPPVVARLEDGRVLVDPRTVAEDEEEALVAAFAAAASS